MLANRKHPDPPDRAGANLLQKARHRSHEAILHPDPNEAGMLGGRLHHPKAMLDLRAQRLFDEDVLAGAKNRLKHLVVSEVRRRNHDGIDGRAHEELAVVRVFFDIPTRGELAKAAAPLVGVGDGRDPHAGNDLQVADVLAPHHAGTDDPELDGVARHLASVGHAAL